MTAAAPVMRLRRPRWKDPRLIVGVVLVIASVLMGALLVSRLSQTATVLVARTDIVPGQVLDASVLTTVDVRLGDQDEMYVGDIGAIPEGAVASHAVRSGELLPSSAVGQAVDISLRPVVIPVGSAVAESVTVGAPVELWHTEDADKGSGETSLLVEDAVVRRIDEGSALGMQSRSVEVLVPQDRLAEVLEVLARGERLDVIGVPGAYGTGR
ncbi:SAF domain-containing protein [Brachybacterium sp. DNPG3]